MLGCLCFCCVCILCYMYNPGNNMVMYMYVCVGGTHVCAIISSLLGCLWLILMVWPVLMSASMIQLLLPSM